MTTAWLQDLEERVKATADRLGELRAENGRLEKRLAGRENRVAELEQQLAAAPDAEEAAAWVTERDDIRQRVEKLVDHLGEMLED